MCKIKLFQPNKNWESLFSIDLTRKIQKYVSGMKNLIPGKRNDKQKNQEQKVLENKC